MIETSEPVVERPAVAGAAKLPVRAGTGRFLVLVAVFICAACGLVYELELIALADYLVGDTVTHTSVVLSLMVFAMGIGSLSAKRLRGRASLNFGLIEALLALVGGSSAISLYLCFVLFGESRPMLVGLSLAMGALIGAEMPLLMTLIQRIRRQDPGRAMADLSAADYVGALLGGLAFPFLLLPLLGQLTAPLLTGVINALAGGAVVLWLFRSDLPRRARRRLYAVNVLVVGCLVACAAAVGPLERAAERELAERDGHATVQEPREK
jgi:predicted membrane-bound spermidine synthase